MEETSMVSAQDPVIRTTLMYAQESKEAKRGRMLMNQTNYDIYHLKQDYSHKKAGQSREFLAKQSMAVEQICAFIQQGLIDIDDWFNVELSPGVETALITPNQVQDLIERQLDTINFMTVVGDSLKLGLLGSLMIAKVHGEYVNKPRYKIDKEIDPESKTVTPKLKMLHDTNWQLKIDLVRQEDYHPDPTGNGLYELQDIQMDYAEVKKLSRGKNAIYDEALVTQAVSAWKDEEDQKAKKARETGQNVTLSGFRKRCKITEGWGTILDPDTAEVLYENVTWTILNDQWLIAPPKANPFWHNQSPFVVSPIVRVPHSVWHKALMDAPTRHNIALNEIYNLILDAGMMATFGIKQLRSDWLENETQVQNGINPGETLSVNNKCPPGGKVLERVDTSSMSAESLQVFQLTTAEFQQSALTNDLRMGILPARQVKATEVVEASQSITSVFTSVAKTVEEDYLQSLLYKSWITMCQNLDDFDNVEVQKLLGKEAAQKLAGISREERFVELVAGHVFNVYGVSRMLDKSKDFKKLTTLIQTIGASETLMQEFIKQYDFGKLLGEIMDSLGINKDKLHHDETTQLIASMAQMQGGGGGSEGGLTQGMTANAQSQVPQAGAGPQNETLQSRISDQSGRFQGQINGGMR